MIQLELSRPGSYTATPVAKSFQLIGFDFPVQRPLADAEHFGRPAAVSPVLPQRRLDGRLLHLRHGHPGR